MSSTPDRTEVIHHTHSDEEKGGAGLHRTVTGVTMSPELFEKVNLNPLGVKCSGRIADAEPFYSSTSLLRCHMWVMPTSAMPTPQLSDSLGEYSMNGNVVPGVAL